MALRLKAEGDTAWREERWNDAINAWTEALKARDCPEDMFHTLYSNRSAAHLKLSNGRSAETDARIVVAMKPHWAKGHMRLGGALMVLERHAEAAEAFRAAYDIEPSNREYQAAASDARYSTSLSRST